MDYIGSSSVFMFLSPETQVFQAPDFSSVTFPKESLGQRYFLFPFKRLKVSSLLRIVQEAHFQMVGCNLVYPSVSQMLSTGSHGVYLFSILTPLLSLSCLWLWFLLWFWNIVSDFCFLLNYIFLTSLTYYLSDLLMGNFVVNILNKFFPPLCIAFYIRALSFLHFLSVFSWYTLWYISVCFQMHFDSLGISEYVVWDTMR